MRSAGLALQLLSDPCFFEPGIVEELPGELLEPSCDPLADPFDRTFETALAPAADAAATKVEVSVVAGKDVVLRVRDDGRGLAADGAGGGLGLRNMATRAEQLDGRFTARAEDSGGTLVEWAVPAS